MMERGRLSFQHIIHNPFIVQGDDGPTAFVGLQEEAVVGVVVEEILGEGCGAEGVLEDEEVAFPVGITVAVCMILTMGTWSMMINSLRYGYNTNILFQYFYMCQVLTLLPSTFVSKDLKGGGILATTTIVSVLILIAFGDLIAYSLAGSRWKQDFRKEKQ